MATPPRKCAQMSTDSHIPSQTMEDTFESEEMQDDDV